MELPPATSLSACLSLLAISVGIAAARYLAGLAGLFRETEVKLSTARYLKRQYSATVEPAGIRSALHRFYRTPSAFLIFWLPWLAFMCGNIGVSLLRDAGYTIFPWPIAINSMLLGFWLFLSAVLKYHRIARLAQGSW